MPAYFSFASTFYEEFKIPHLAFKILVEKHVPTIQQLFTFPSLPNLPNKNNPGPLILSLDESALLMCGTTQELTDALKLAQANNLEAFHVPGSDGLCVHYARIRYKNSSTPISVLSLAPLRGWWRAEDFYEAGRPAAYEYFLPASKAVITREKYKDRIDWKSYSDGPIPNGIRMAKLLNSLQLFDGVKTWIDVPEWRK